MTYSHIDFPLHHYALQAGRCTFFSLQWSNAEISISGDVMNQIEMSERDIRSSHRASKAFLKWLYIFMFCILYFISNRLIFFYQRFCCHLKILFKNIIFSYMLFLFYLKIIFFLYWNIKVNDHSGTNCSSPLYPHVHRLKLNFHICNDAVFVS